MTNRRPRAKTRRSRGREALPEIHKGAPIHEHRSLRSHQPRRHPGCQPAALPDAAGGVALRFALYDGPLAFTLTDDEARWLVTQIERQLAAGEDAGCDA